MDKLATATKAARGEFEQFTKLAEATKVFDPETLTSFARGSIEADVIHALMNDWENRRQQFIRDLAEVRRQQKAEDEQISRMFPQGGEATPESFVASQPQDIREQLDPLLKANDGNFLKTTGQKMKELQEIADLLKEIQERSIVDPFTTLSDPKNMASIEAIQKLLDTSAKSPLNTGIDASVTKLNEALSKLGVSQMGALDQYEQALETAKKAFEEGRIGIGQMQEAQLAEIEAVVRKQREGGIAISTDQSKAIIDLQQKLAKANVDVFGSVYKEISQAVDALDTGLAHALLNFKNFGSEMKKTLSSVLEGVFTDVFKQLTKPLTDWLTKTLSNAISPIVDRIATSLGLKVANKGIDKGIDAATGAATKAGTDAATKAGTSAANAGASGASGAASSASSLMGTVSAVGAAVSAVSSVISNFQFAGMNKSLDVLVNHTLRIFNLLQQIHDQEWERHYGILAKFDMVFNRLGDIWATLREGKQGSAILDAAAFSSQLGAAISGVISTATAGIHADLADIASAVREVTQTLKAGHFGTESSAAAAGTPSKAFDGTLGSLHSDLSGVIAAVAEVDKTLKGGFRGSGESSGATSKPQDIGSLHKDLTEINASLSQVNKSITVGLRGAGESLTGVMGDGIHRDLVTVTEAVDKVEKSVRSGLFALTDAVKAGPKATQNQSLDRSGSAAGGRTSGGLTDSSSISGSAAQVRPGVMMVPGLRLPLRNFWRLQA